MLGKHWRGWMVVAGLCLVHDIASGQGLAQLPTAKARAAAHAETDKAVQRVQRQARQDVNFRAADRFKTQSGITLTTDGYRVYAQGKEDTAPQLIAGSALPSDAQRTSYTGKLIALPGAGLYAHIRYGNGVARDYELVQALASGVQVVRQISLKEPNDAVLAVQGDDQQGWLVLRDGRNFCSYRVAENRVAEKGIARHAVKNTQVLPKDITTIQRNAQLLFTPDGKQLVLAVNGADALLQLPFDTATGKVGKAGLLATPPLALGAGVMGFEGGQLVLPTATGTSLLALPKLGKVGKHGNGAAQAWQQQGKALADENKKLLGSKRQELKQLQEKYKHAGKDAKAKLKNEIANGKASLKKYATEAEASVKKYKAEVKAAELKYKTQARAEVAKYKMLGKEKVKGYQTQAKAELKAAPKKIQQGIMGFMPNPVKGLGGVEKVVSAARTAKAGKQPRKGDEPAQDGKAATTNALEQTADEPTTAQSMASHTVATHPVGSALGGAVEKRQAARWYFGGAAGLDFNTQTITALGDSKLSQLEGTASIADTAGNLLFYTDGSTVYNRLHQVMQDGEGLLGHASSTQGALIVPHPANDEAGISAYYLITVDQGGYAGRASEGLRYNLIDMNRAGGLGAVTEKNTLLDAQTTEKLNATLHADGRSIWVVTHRSYGDQFAAYLLSAEGMSTTPVISKVGSVHYGSENTIGQLKLSADGSRLALVVEGSGLIEVFSFDNKTGRVSKAIQLAGDKPASKAAKNIPHPYGIEFSPNATKLYISSWRESGVYQYDLNAPSDSLIAMSQTYLTSKDDNLNGGALQLGPDGRIYQAQQHKFDPSAESYLGVINNPDNAGELAQYKNHGIQLPQGVSKLGLPNLLASWLMRPKAVIEARQFCAGLPTHLEPGGGHRARATQWVISNDEQAIFTSQEKKVNYTFDSPGSYSIKLVAAWGAEKDSTVRTITISAPARVHLPSPQQLPMDGSALRLSVKQESADASYQWSTGETTPSIEVQSSGQYSVQIFSGSCVNTHKVTVLPAPPSIQLSEASAAPLFRSTRPRLFAPNLSPQLILAPEGFGPPSVLSAGATGWRPSNAAFNEGTYRANAFTSPSPAYTPNPTALAVYVGLRLNLLGTK